MYRVANDDGEADTVTGPCYAANSRFGALQLSSFEGAPVRHAAEAAIALGRHAALLGALEDWVGESLDWRWTPQPLAGGPRAAVVCLNEASTHIGARLDLPWTLPRTLGAPSADLAGRLRWPEVASIVTVATLDLADAELQALEPGGALVLAASLRADWCGAARAADEPPGTGVALALSPPPGPLHAKILAAPAGTPEGRLEVRISAPERLPGDALTGWAERPAFAAGGETSLWRAASAGAASRLLATGRLMPWGAGWALAIEALH